MFEPPHRKRVRHYDEPGHFHELTFSCFRRMPLLSNDSWRAELSRAIDRAVAGQGYRLAAFVYMPEHVHLIVYPMLNANGIDRLLRAIKRPYSYHIKNQLASAGNSLLRTLTIHQRPGVETFRFWQEGPGYDRNLTEPRTVLSAIDYMHLNPVRRRLCESAVAWPWSSARHYSAEKPPDDPFLPVVHGLSVEFFDSTDR